MQWYRNLRYFWKITLPLLLIGALFIVNAFLGINFSRTIAGDAQKIGGVFLDQVNLLLQADRDLYQTLIAERALVYIVPTNPAYFAEHKENLQQANERVKKALSLGDIDNADKVARQFDTLYEHWAAITKKVVAAQKAGDKALALRLSQNESEPAFEALHHEIDLLQEAQIQKSAQYTAAAHSRSDEASSILISMLIGGLLLCAAVIFFVPSTLTRQLQVIRQQVEKIASGQGDLTARVPVNSTDEVGQLASNFNEFLDQLHTMIRRIKQAAEQVAESSDQLKQVSTTNHRAMQSQNLALEMVVSSVHEMSCAIREVTQNTQETAQQAKISNDLSGTGLSTVNRTVTQIQHVAQLTNSVSTLISEVEDQAASATSVLVVIRSIAEQTNLLALNAAIEAARAGEQGRGFAVVADEVRTLASRTQDSTADIQKMLEQLQSGVQEAVAAMKNSADSANSTVETANDAGSALRNINDAIASITGMAVQIAATVEEQSTVIEDINRNLVEISNQSNTTSENVEKTDKTSQQLAAASQELLRNVANFKL